MKYLLIDDIRVSKANALATPWLITTNPLFATGMLCHLLSSKFDLSPDTVEEFALVIHDTQLLAEQLPGDYGRYTPHQFKGATFIDENDWVGKKIQNGSGLQPSASFHCTISLILKVSNYDTPGEQSIKQFLLQSRVAGGPIISVGEVAYYDSLAGDSGLFHAMGHAGFVVLDRKDLVGTDAMNSFTRALTMPKPAESPWISAAVAGYSLLEDEPGIRDGVRNIKRADVWQNCLHAFAEPLVGLVEFKSIREIDQENIFWSHSWPDDTTFVLAQNSPT